MRGKLCETRPAPRAFTLVEALMGSVILALGAAMLGGFYFAALQNAAMETDQMLLDSALRSELELLIGMDFAAVAGGTSSLNVGGQSYTLTRTVANVDLDGDGTPEPDAKQITVSISGRARALTTIVVDTGGQVGKL